MGPNLLLLLFLGLAGKVRRSCTLGPMHSTRPWHNWRYHCNSKVCRAQKVDLQVPVPLCQWVDREVPALTARTPTTFPPPGQGSATSLPEALQAPVGGAILVQCHYRLQDIRAPKVWCRFLPEGCQPLVSSAVDRGAPGDGRMFLTDLGGGLLQVEMIGLREEDSGEYGCVVEGSAGPLTVHRVALDVFPPGELS